VQACAEEVAVRLLFHPHDRLQRSRTLLPRRLQQVICPIERVTWRGVNCSDAVGTEIDFQIVQSLLRHNATTPARWNETLASPYFNFRDAGSGEIYQVSRNCHESRVDTVGLCRSTECSLLPHPSLA
jgi:hypothetical protein